jgi:hypothetical protein
VGRTVRVLCDPAEQAAEREEDRSENELERRREAGQREADEYDITNQRKMKLKLKRRQKQKRQRQMWTRLQQLNCQLERLFHCWFERPLSWLARQNRRGSEGAETEQQKTDRQMNPNGGRRMLEQAEEGKSRQEMAAALALAGLQERWMACQDETLADQNHPIR